MIRQTAIALVLAATAVLAPISALAETPVSTANVRPSTTSDNRISFNVYNSGISFVNFTVDGQSYTLSARNWMSIKAPAGTAIVAGTNVLAYKRGDTILTVSEKVRGTRVTLY